MAKRVTTKRERVLERALQIEREIADEAHQQRRYAESENEDLKRALKTARDLNDTFREDFNRVCKERDLAIAACADIERARDANAGIANSQRERAEHFRRQRELLLDMILALEDPTEKSNFAAFRGIRTL